MECMNVLQEGYQIYISPTASEESTEPYHTNLTQLNRILKNIAHFTAMRHAAYGKRPG